MKPHSHLVDQSNVSSQGDDIHAQILPFSVMLPEADKELMEEFAAWEAASDEALINFEKESFCTKGSTLSGRLA